MRTTSRRPATSRVARMPARRATRAATPYASAAEVPDNLPVGTHITLPKGEPPPPGFTPVGDGEDGED